MDLLYTEDAASVILFDIRMSESELQCLAISLEYVLTHLNEQQLHKEFAEGDECEQPAETREFLEGTFHELMSLIQKHCHPEFLDARFLNWKGPSA